MHALWWNLVRHKDDILCLCGKHRAWRRKWVTGRQKWARLVMKWTPCWPERHQGRCRSWLDPWWGWTPCGRMWISVSTATPLSMTLQSCSGGNSEVPILRLLCLMWWLRWLHPLSRECRLLGCQEQILCRPPRTWFWGTHKWAISAALLSGRVSRTAGYLLVFGRLLHRGIELRSLCQSSSESYSVCSSLLWGERSWQVMQCVLVWVVFSSLAVEDGFLFITNKSFGFSVGQMWWGSGQVWGGGGRAPFSFLILRKMVQVRVENQPVCLLVLKGEIKSTNSK